MKKVRRIFCAVLLLAMLLLGGCGRQGRPIELAPTEPEETLPMGAEYRISMNLYDDLMWISQTLMDPVPAAIEEGGRWQDDTLQEAVRAMERKLPLRTEAEVAGFARELIPVLIARGYTSGHYRWVPWYAEYFQGVWAVWYIEETRLSDYAKDDVMIYDYDGFLVCVSAKDGHIILIRD